MNHDPFHPDPCAHRLCALQPQSRRQRPAEDRQVRRCRAPAQNLGGEKGLANTAIAALVEGLATTSPTGKQASFASRSRASYVRIEKGSQQPRSLAAAFLRPVKSEDLLKSSIDMLEDMDKGLVAQMNAAYGACFDDARTMRFIAGEPGNSGSITDLIRFASE